MKLTLTLEYHGWLDIEVTDEAGQYHCIPASFLTDVISDILEDVSNLIEGASETITVVQTEPNESRIRIHCNDGKCTFEILGFNNNFLTEELCEGVCDFKTQIKLKDLASQIMIEINKLQDLGSEEYKHHWGYDFPQEAYERFEKAWSLL